MRTSHKPKPNSAFAKIDAKRKRYNPDLEGYGNADQWRKSFSERIGFEEAQEVFSHPYYLDQRTEWPEQYRAIGWVGEQLYTVIFEVREDEEREYYHLVTLWKATKQEQQLYGEHS